MVHRGNSGVTLHGSNNFLLRATCRVFVVQGPAFFLADETVTEVSAAEAGFALTGLITCTILFIGYLMYQVCLSIGADTLGFGFRCHTSVFRSIYLTRA